MTQESLTAFFGWMAVINIAFLGISTLLVLALRDWAARLHSNLFGLEAASVREAMYSWLGTYELATLILTVTPYFALRIM